MSKFKIQGWWKHPCPPSHAHGYVDTEPMSNIILLQ